MTWDDSRIVVSNGQPYRVGWRNGWFSIQRVQKHPEEDEYVPARAIHGDGKAEIVSFPPGKTDELIEAINQR